jgi:hypothetical protein
MTARGIPSRLMSEQSDGKHRQYNPLGSVTCLRCRSPATVTQTATKFSEREMGPSPRFLGTSAP